MKNYTKFLPIIVFLFLYCISNGQSIIINGDSLSFPSGSNSTYTLNACTNTKFNVNYISHTDTIWVQTKNKIIPMDSLYTESYQKIYTGLYFLGQFDVYSNGDSTILKVYANVLSNISSIKTTDPPYCGQNAKVVLTSQVGIDSVSWNIGNSHDSIDIATYNGDSAYFTGIVTLKDGCVDTNREWVHTLVPDGKGLCWATVDSSSAHNIIVWDSNGFSNTGVDSVKLYFYNSKSQWQKLGEESFNISDTSKFFIDTVNDPNANTVRYNVTLVTSCGQEEPFSNSLWQNTMHIIYSGSGQFSWAGTGYQIQNNGLPVLTYYLFKDTGSGYYAVDSISGSQNQMTDTHYSSTAQYYCGALLNIPLCPLSNTAISKRPLSVASTLSHSNTINKLFPAGIQNINSSDIRLYPVPASNQVTIEGITGYAKIDIYDVTGRSIYETDGVGKRLIDISSFNDGVFFVFIQSGNHTVVRKIIKQTVQ